MTAQEAANACGAAKASPDNPEIEAFLKTASARELQDFIHLIQIVDRHRYFFLARVALKVRLSEDAAKSAAKMERYTRWLIFFTIALIFLTAYLCFDVYRNHHSADSSNHAVLPNTALEPTATAPLVSTNK